MPNSKQAGQASIFAILALPVILLLGLGGADVSHWLSKRESLREAVKSASLLLADQISRNGSINQADTILSNLAEYYFGDEVVQFRYAKTQNQIEVWGEVTLNTWYLGLFIANFNKIDMRYYAAAEQSWSPGNLDMSIVVDLSSSMGTALSSGSSTSNLAQLQTATLSLLEDLPDSVAIGLVPFHSQVTINGAIWLPESYGTPLCVDGYSGLDPSINADEIVNHVFLHDSQISKITEPQQGGEFLAENCPPSPLMPLTQDKILIEQTLLQLPDASGSSTESAHGIIWGIRTLLESWQGRWSLEDLPRKNVNKVLVLLTDGSDTSNNMQYLVDAGLCEQARQQKIDLWFIGFGVSGWASTDPDHYLRRCFQDHFRAADGLEDLQVYLDEVIQSASSRKIFLKTPKQS